MDEEYHDLLKDPFLRSHGMLFSEFDMLWKGSRPRGLQAA